MKKIFYLFITIVLLFSCSREDAVTSASYNPSDEPPAAVNSLIVTQSRLISAVKSSGIIQGITTVTINSEVSGTIENLNFTIGDYVNKNDSLLKIDDDLMLLELEKVRLDYELAKLDYEASTAFYKTNSISYFELVTSESNFKTAALNLEIAENNYNNCRIKSPVNGYIIETGTNLDPGNNISNGSFVAVVSDISILKIEIDVGEREISLIEEGAAAEISIPAADSELFSGTVNAAAAGGNTETGAYRVIIIFENTDDSAIKPGMTAGVDISTVNEPVSVIIPSDAVLFHDGNTFVFIDSNGTAEARLIETGRTYNNRIEIVNGLETGEKLIITRISQIKPGDPVISTVTGESGSWR
jgi:RND family efflux transporter MFP subunit